MKFTKDPRETKMFGGIGEEVYKFEQNNLTFNSHDFGFSPQVFEDDEYLSKFWDVTSVSYMPDGRPFVASIEAKNYPILATQYHPEKPSQLWVDTYQVDHSLESI